MDINSIITIVAVAVPTISNVITAIATLVKVFKNFDDLKREVRDRTDLDQFREQMNRILEENLKLKEQMSALIEYTDVLKAITVTKTKE